ncbi:MAG: phospho-N-acetylmuramoyl-pentapeptide-transferase [Bacteroidaceae bacterium]|nr:phospho-N-acetylmuramoyl-pentapeptide-transferase [Bacteroidaceae bacterium]
MLYYLFRYLEQFGIPGSAMWGYISFRSLLALMLALVISMVFGEYFIKYMRRRNIGETARDVSIDPFGVEKKGVPSMGGIIIIVAILIPVVLLGRLRNIYLLLMVATTVWFGLVGFADDYIKIFKKTKDGLAGRWKILAQVLMGLFIGLTLYWSPDAVIRENIEHQRVGDVTEIVHKSEAVKSTKTTIPFFKNNNFDYADLVGWLGEHKQTAGWIVFVLMVILVTTAVSNGANLNDGMDGMAAGNSAIICVALGVLAYVSSHIEYASYLNIMFVPGSEELVVFICATVGALIGFLWYNAYPAQVFMGDTGSLAIGGIIGVLAIIIHKELLVPVLCGVFLFESLSVIIQTQTFKFFKRKGRRVRVFKSTPIHDAFRRLDSQLDPTSTYLIRRWPRHPFHESKITIRFWITTILLAAFTIITLKIR